MVCSVAVGLRENFLRKPTIIIYLFYYYYYLFIYFIIYFQNDRTDHPASRASFCLLDGEGGKEDHINSGFWETAHLPLP